MDQLRALAGWLLSFRTHDWTIDDYPIRLHEQDEQPRWWASIVNWPGPTGLGATPEEARADLAETIERIRAAEGLPRPGSRPGLRFADDAGIRAHRVTVDRLIADVLDLEWAFVSDATTLDDFELDDGDGTRYVERIREVFGVDVSHIESGNVAEIAACIDATAERSAG